MGGKVLLESIVRKFGQMAQLESNTFLYFAFGSNMWTQRIHENNPSAKFESVAKLKGYRLEFAHMTTRWRGSASNIFPDPESHLYGILWELDQCHQESLDKQEGVPINEYERIEVAVETVPEGKIVNCFAYQLRPETRQQSIEVHGKNLLPSLRYKNVMIQGAKDHGIPQEYIQMLTNLPDNGYNGDVDVNIPQIRTA